MFSGLRYPSHEGEGNLEGKLTTWLFEPSQMLVSCILISPLQFLTMIDIDAQAWTHVSVQNDALYMESEPSDILHMLWFHLLTLLLLKDNDVSYEKQKVDGK